MKANELRKNNLVEYSDGGGFVELSSLEIHRIDIGQVQVKPIPLTKEWLLRFGFRKYNDNWFSKGALWINISDFAICVGLEFKQVNIRKQINVVHKLQNLYFEIENEELTFNNG